MRFVTSVLASVAVLTATAAVAQNLDAITARKALLKEMGAASQPIGGMMRGLAPFDLATVKKSLGVMATNAGKLPAHFPENSKTGGDTEALPAIWANKADFDARFAKLAADAKAAEAAVKDEANFRQTVGPVFANCQACHDTYRVKK